MAANSEQHYSLRWNDYTVKICTAFQALRDEEDFVDVTVACDGHHYSAHKMVLSACSPYFRSLLRANPCQHPIVILKDVGHTEMERLLEFMYNGEVNIAQDQLAAFLKTAESLRIRGLAGSSEEIDQSQNREISQNSYSCITNNTCGNNLNTNSRGSPCGVNFSQEKDDDITSDVFHINSPPAKRRKRTSGTSLIANTENSTSHNTDSLTGDNMLSGPPDPTMEMEDPTLHPDSVREFKSEPCDALQDVYAETDELTHQQHHNDAMPGPSGSLMSNQEDGLATNAVSHGGAAAACEALNLSVRSTPASMNGPSTSSHCLPASTSIQPRIPGGQSTTAAALYCPNNMPIHHHETNPVENHSAPLQVVNLNHMQQHHCHAFDDEQDVKVHPSALIAAGHVMNIGPPSANNNDVHLLNHHSSSSDAQIYTSPECSAAIDLVCTSQEMKVFATANNNNEGGQVLVSSLPECSNGGGPHQGQGGDLKTKVYPCPECLKVFRHPMSLHHHRHVHKGTYTCQSCGKVFSRRWDLHRHIHRSKMGCRRPPNHHHGNSHHVIVSTSPPGLRQRPPYDLNNPPST